MGGADGGTPRANPNRRNIANLPMCTNGSIHPQHMRWNTLSVHHFLAPKNTG